MSHWLSRTIIIALVISVFIHLGFWGGMEVLSILAHSKVDDKIEIEILDKEAQEKLAKNSKDKKQIVDQDKRRINDETPKDSKFLSRHNQTIKEQTKASRTGAFNNSAGGGAPAQGSQMVNRQVRKKTPPRKVGKTPSLSRFLPKYGKRAPKSPTTGAGRNPAAPSATSDYLPDVKEGLQTLLSTREFVYYSYYSRIRNKIRQFWEPAIREKVRRVFRQGRSIASTRDRITKVIIVLNDSGRLVKVQIIGESGIADLDEAAVEAFRAAEPFPNPPDGIVEADGRIRIRWDFVLETG